jgi:hypothetical protein
MKRLTLAMILVLAAACEAKKASPEAKTASAEAKTASAEGKKASDEGDSPEEIAQRKAECLRLEDHIFEIMPRPGAERGEPDPKKRAELVAQLPVEDIDQCAAVKDRKVIACMQAASDEKSLRACIPASKD